MSNKLLILCNFIILLMFTVGAVAATEVTFEIKKIRKTQGDLHYQIFNCNNPEIDKWDDLTLLSSGVVTPNSAKIKVKTQFLVTRLSCIRIFQDTNGSGTLEFSESGIPNEAVGFSDNPSLMLGYPKPQSTAVVLKEGDDRLLSIKMNYRRKR